MDSLTRVIATGRAAVQPLIAPNPVLGSWQFWGAEWWDAAQAIGTVGAVAVALILAGWEALRHRSTRRELDALRISDADREEQLQASLVSAWVESEFVPSEDGSHYVQRAMVHVANEGNEPVFNVYVRVGIGLPVVQIGPLSVPVPLPVLPPRRTRTFDISLPLMAHLPPVGATPEEPLARIDFSDAAGTRWHRDYEGRLTRSSGRSTPLMETGPDAGEEQLGPLDNSFNPMQSAYLFWLCAISDPPTPVDEIRWMLAPNAPAWSDFDEEDWAELRVSIENFGLAAHVSYPAPRVAYVRLIHEDDSTREVSEAGFVQVRALITTLVFLPGAGWRIFSVGPGATRPDWIGFEPGSLLEDIRSEGPSAASEPSA